MQPRLEHGRARTVLLGAIIILGLITGCDGPQSALDAAGADAERVARLFRWMAGGAAVIWSAVVVLAIVCVRVDPDRHRDTAARTLIIGGGAVVPTIVLGALLAYGLSVMPDLLALPPPGGLVVAVSGEQWWWRVRYHPPVGEVRGAVLVYTVLAVAAIAVVGTVLLHGALAVAALGALAFLGVAAGLVPIKASSGHWGITEWLLKFAMRRSVAMHSMGIDVPVGLDDPVLVLRGAGHYEGGCVPCHGAPAAPDPLIPRRMTPHPPDLVEVVAELDPEEPLLHRQARGEVHRHAGLGGSRPRRRGVGCGGVPPAPARPRRRVVRPAGARRVRSSRRRG